MKYQMNYIYTKLLTLKESPNMAGTQEESEGVTTCLAPEGTVRLQDELP